MTWTITQLEDLNPQYLARLRQADAALAAAGIVNQHFVYEGDDCVIDGVRLNADEILALANKTGGDHGRTRMPDVHG